MRKPYVQLLLLTLVLAISFYTAIASANTPPNSSPVADHGGPYYGTVGVPVTLDGTGSYDPDPGDTLTYLWEGLWDDPTWSEIGPIASHTYSAPGTYDVRLWVQDSSHNLVWADTTVTIFGPVTIESCDSGGNPQDDFMPGEMVYAQGSGFLPRENVTIYVVPNDGPYTAAASLYSTLVTADSAGIISPKPIGSYTVGKYDIWVDRYPWDGILYIGDADGIDEAVDTFGLDYGFFVVPEYPLGTILGLAMCLAALAVFKSKNLRIHL